MTVHVHLHLNVNKLCTDAYSHTVRASCPRPISENTRATQRTFPELKKPQVGAQLGLRCA